MIFGNLKQINPLDFLMILPQTLFFEFWWVNWSHMEQIR